MNLARVRNRIVENPYATYRNDHQLFDTYNPVDNTLDIRSNALWPANVLSNLWERQFVHKYLLCNPQIVTPTWGVILIDAKRRNRRLVFANTITISYWFGIVINLSFASDLGRQL